MISKKQNEALLILANSAKEKAEWVEYANYCFDREKGLRKNAFKHLEIFIKNSKKWVLGDRIGFVCFIFQYFETLPDSNYADFPHPLNEILIKPTLEEWCSFENKDNRPFRWYGRYYGSEEHLLRALELDPLDDIARNTIISSWSNGIYYSIHHLPDYYIGDPYESITLSNKIKIQISLLVDNVLKTRLEKILEKELDIIRNYIEWKESGYADFKKWGEENHKLTGYEGIRTYHY